MSSSLQGVLVDREKVLELSPGDDLVAVVIVRLSEMLVRFYPFELDREDYVEAFQVALNYLRDRGAHPGRTAQGSFLTCSILQILGSEVHSNLFNPFRWPDVSSMNDELVSAGSPISVIDPSRSAGPWGLSDSDYYFIGGWDQPTLRTISSCIASINPEHMSPRLREFNRWIHAAIENELTVWAWHA